MDKAGAYAIQGKGSFMVRDYSGSHSNIIGLPIDELKILLKKTGFQITPEKIGFFLKHWKSVPKTLDISMRLSILNFTIF